MVNQIKLWQKFRSSIRGVDSSRQLALGVTMGMIIGLLPKDSLLPYCLLGILILSRANLLSAACSALVFSWISPVLDPVSHEIGIRVLTFDPIEPIWAWLIQLPIVPWVRFDNTVVMGTFLIGLLLALPVYKISNRFFQRYGNLIYRVFRKSWIACWLIGPPHTDIDQPVGQMTLSEGPA